MMPSVPPPGPPLPDAFLDEAGEPRLGTYFGPAREVDLSRAWPRLGRSYAFSHEKRWFYVAIATEELYIGVAIADLGYAANAFAFAASLKDGVLGDVSFLGVPKLGCHVGNFPEEGCDAWFRAPGAHFSLSRGKGASTYDLVVSTKLLQLHAAVDTARAPTALTAVARPLGGDVNVTEKRALCDVRGTLVVRDQRHVLDGGFGGMDYTHGFLPRVTAWRWAYMMGRTTEGRRVAMNLVEGFNGQPECCVWLDRQVVSVGEGRFTFDREHPLSPWHVATDDGAVDLRFEPVGMHAEERDLVFIRSRFVQPIGTYHGRITLPRIGTVEIDGAPGVTEDQSVRW